MAATTVESDSVVVHVPAGDVKWAVLALDDPRWGAFVASCPAATPFHHPAWGSLLAEAYGFRAFAVVVHGSDGGLVAGAPFLEARDVLRRRSWISLPFTDECAPLAADGCRLTELLSVLADAGLHAASVKIRSAVEAEDWSTRTAGVLHLLELDRDPERVRRGFSRSQVVRNIARGEREGVEVRAAASREDLDVFYVLHLRTRSRQGVPVQPRRFFDLLWARILEPGLGEILLAYRGETALAGALFLAWNGTTIYKYGASDPQGWPLRPNHPLFWTAIRDACHRGDRCFDFGRSDLANTGLRAFKSSWGAAEQPLVYSTVAPCESSGNARFPERLLEAVIRAGPTWVCRGIGETVYRYAALR
jgi:CelD/BcsL family acetyltransferase involved in cellulose biosynthesis